MPCRGPYHPSNHTLTLLRHCYASPTHRTPTRLTQPRHCHACPKQVVYSFPSPAANARANCGSSGEAPAAAAAAASAPGGEGGHGGGDGEGGLPADLAEGLAGFCFPAGVRPELLERTPSMSALNEVIYSQPYQTHDDHSFVFLMKVRGWLGGWVAARG